MPSLTEILQAAGSPDANLRQQAELELRKFEQADFAGYIQGICAELADPNKPPAVRQLAGLVLKNTMSSPDAAKQKELESRWTLQGVPVRAKIKAVTLQVLASPVGDARKTAAQVISRIAAIEMPHDQWPELIGQLVASVQQGSDDLKEASFTTLGFVCEEVPEHLEKHANSILNAINIGMQATQTNNKIKLAATKALVNSLEFTHNNFAEQRQRDMIMELVFGVCGSSDEQCQIFAFQCLVEMGQLYYDHLTPYMPRIFGLTKAGIENFKQREQVALRAIEFWSTTCDEEADIIEENEIAADKQKAPERKLLNFVETAMSSLLPLVLQCLTCQEEDTDEDDWNIAMAAGSCLGLIAQTARNKVCDFVLPFVQANIQDADWHKREAAVLAFGSILNGPDPDKLKPLVGQVFGLLLNLLEDSSVAVQDSAAWTIGRVCDLLPSAIDERIIEQLMAALIKGLQTEPRVASNICWAIHNLADAADGSGDETSVLSKYFQNLAQSLLATANRSDADENNLRGSCYEALNVLVSNSANDVFPTVEMLLPEFMNRLSATIVSSGLSGEEKEKQNEIRALLSGAIQNIVSKLDDEKVKANADNLMQLFLQVLQSNNAAVHEEVLMAIGAVANAVSGEFLRYMPHFKDFLLAGLRNTAAHQVCKAATGVIGDVCRALQDKIIPNCDEIVQALLQNLQNGDLERNVKPTIISCLGDLALAVGPQFDRYLTYVMMLVSQAAAINFTEDEKDLDTIDWINHLRESCFEAFTGILQGLASGSKQVLFVQHVDAVVQLIALVCQDEDRDLGVLRNAAGLVGDLASLLGAQVVKQKLSRPEIRHVLTLANDSDDERAKENAVWAMQQLQAAG